MPIYEYLCEKCGHAFEAIRPVGDDGSDLRCAECGAPRPRKLPSVFAAGGACSIGPSGFG